VKSRLQVTTQPAVSDTPDTSDLAIAELRVYPVREPVSGRSYTVVRLKTRSGLIGYGECAEVTSHDLAAARQFWVGRAATSYSHAPESSLAGGIDMALLDIVGKACRTPIYRILGGPTRNKARALTSVEGANITDTVAAVKRALSAGYRCLNVHVPSPHERNQGQAYEREVRQLLDAVRSEGSDFVLDGGERLSPGDAGSVAATVQSLHPLWFNDPCVVTNLLTIRKISDESVVPLGFGSTIRTPGTFQDLLRDGLVDIVRPDLGYYGITRTRRIAALAETYYVAVAPHHEGGPVATAAALQLAASLPNFFIQHIPFPAAEEDRKMRAELVSASVEQVNDGFASLPAEPGLGITVNEIALEKYRAA
jgi:galactonate dehydratase